MHACASTGRLPSAVPSGGLGLAIACDLIVAAEGTHFNLAYTRIGNSSDCDTSWDLPRRMGLRRALEMALLCEPIDAVQAESQTWCPDNPVAPAAEPAECIDAIDRPLETSAPLVLGQPKRPMRRCDQHDLQTQLQAEAECFAALFEQPALFRRPGCFLDKRPPVFNGH